MTVLVVGGGGREHAILRKLRESPRVTRLYAAPGNGGIAAVAECVPVKATDIEGMVAFAKEKQVDFCVIAPDDPLVLGMADAMEEAGISYKTLFLDAADDKLIARYKSSRRRHPLCTDGTTIWQGIQRERHLLMGLRDRADFVIDTTDMLPQKLRSTIRGLFSTGSERKGLAVTVYSFGFKHGAPYDADLVMDVRFLPNPYYDPELRPLTGLDAPVRDFVRMREETIEFEQKWHELLDVVMPGYVAEGKQQLAIGVGCTGGQHRSVALAEATGDYLKSKGYRVSVAHRDLRLAERGATVESQGDNGLDPRAAGKDA